MTDYDNDPDRLPDENEADQPTQPPLPPDSLPPETDPGLMPTMTDVYALAPDDVQRLAHAQARESQIPDADQPTLPPDLPPMTATREHARPTPMRDVGDTVQHEPPPRATPPTQSMRPVTPPHSQPAVPPPAQTQRHQRPSQPAAPGQYAPPPYGRAGGPPPPPRRTKRPPRRRRWRMISGGCLLTAGAALLVFACMAVTVGVIVWNNLSTRLEDGLQRLDELGDRRVFQTSIIYDRHGGELYQIFDEGRRTNVSLATLPPYVAQASIAVEDDSFYSNPGIDLGSILRAAFQNVQSSGDAFSGIGASTITQQVVRNIAFDYEYRIEDSLQRKIEEAILSVILTSRLSKDEILELYLNEIYYGNLAYGIEAASQTIFGHPASELTLGEAALLAGLPQAPAWLDPLDPDPDVQEAVLARRRLVIDLMLEEGFITQEQATAAYGEPLSYASPDVSLTAPHFTVFARDELESLMATLGYSPDVITSGGLRVYTTLDLRYQELAERTALQQVESLRDAHNLTNAAVVVLHPVTGQVLAMVGSVDYWDDSIDGRVNVALAPRQPGSTMKPFTYSAAIELGWNPTQIIWDSEVHYSFPGQDEYVPVNYDSAYHGPVRMRDALANSYNIPAVQTLQQVGVPYLLDLMERFGVNSLGSDADRYGLSLTLGGGEVTLLELTRAYSVFANSGVLVPTTSILCVLDSDD
ncbi:MAG: transglycosylase domain-containing protein, partial [Anaerolineae bacterium]|nr:transglycosylase domain-containing protein [Anaerolineae bacterium]